MQVKVDLEVTDLGTIKCKVTNEDGTKYSFYIKTLKELKEHKVYDYITHKQYEEVNQLLADLIAYAYRGVTEAQVDINKVMYKKTFNNVIVVKKRESFAVGTLLREGDEFVPLVLSDTTVMNTENVARLAGKLNQQMEHYVSQGLVKNDVTYSEFQSLKDKYLNMLGDAQENKKGTIPDVGGATSYGASKKKEEVIDRLRLK